ncbi:hypothetical protein E1281_16205 [Actinomadura sp. KC345]|uniref:hypothetical protein n=1 Tax=Actinomadura sp. KC345 TaxID=2530371 RepID=UPI001042C463|nr:hypothetical protein [Actinomadura sp. KC345]TDC54460.1 hypothetical protein E1281_16205 [Actinomadura sp. KC345]
MDHGQAELALRKSRGAIWGKVAAAVVAIGALAGEMALGFGREAALVSAVLVTVLLVVLVWEDHRARLTLTAHEIVVRDVFRRRRRPRARIARMVRATIHRVNAESEDALFLLDARGDVLLRVSGTDYKTEDLDRLVDALGVPCDGPDHEVRAAELDSMHPGLTSWAERHPVLLAIVITVVCLVVIAAVIVLAFTYGW